jgi:asparagine synthase (glutamine-hydrolysing)
MCGIAGYVDFSTAPSLDVLNAMALSLGRRGPDDSGTLIDGPCGLAHTRLSIIDLSGSPQPMTLRERIHTIVFNGEIYNYRDLRNELRAAGEVFATEGDTEVLLKLIVRGWDDALPKLDAMFAFAVWDQHSRRLLLARDAVGEKPLFYANPRSGLLIFGSECKALLEHPALDRELDLGSLRQVLRFRAVYGNRSLYRSMRQLEPGSFLEFSAAGLRVGRFHDWEIQRRLAQSRYSGLSRGEAVKQGRELFFQSVRERLVADVPVGAFLSGGLDSSMIVAAMRKTRAPGEEIRTFSVGFSGDPGNELPYAQLVADAIGTNHTPIAVGPEKFLARWAELSSCRDGPVSEASDIAIAEMSRIARQSVKVALSGEGADEVFAGYPKYAFANVSPVLRRILRMTGPRRVAGLAGLLGMDRSRASIAAAALAERREVDRLIQWFSYMSRTELQWALPGLAWSDADWAETSSVQDAALSEIHSSPLSRMQTLDCLTWLPGNLLERGDRMTMAEGLEMRLPFLDKELAAFGLALPDNLKLRGGVGKWILRQWAADLIPDKIVQRKKWGFRVPLAEWFRGPLREMSSEYLTASRGLCGVYGDKDAVKRRLVDHQSGRVDASRFLWTLLTCEVWYQDVYLRRLGEKGQVAAASH